MRISILSQFPWKYTTRRLREACAKRGHDVRVMNPTSFSILVDEGRPSLLYQNRPFERVDAVIPRIGASITFFGTAVLRQLEQMGVFTFNPSQAIAAARDKLRCIQFLSCHNIGLAHTAFVKQPNAILHAIRRVGGAPVIIKVLEGTQGIGVILAESEKGAQSIVETFQEAKQNVLIQKFVAESRGKDVRALVLDGRVLAAMRRSARGDEFRSNVHRGGSAEAIALDPEYERTAIEATNILGLRLAGVDMLESRDGPKLSEVNASPGFEAIERATGVDVADAVVACVERDKRSASSSSTV